MKEHMQTTAEKHNERNEQLEALGFSSEEDYTAHQGLMERMRDLTKQQLQDTRAAGGLQPVHLSETGLHAGRRLCLAPKDDSSRSVHAMYAPLHNPTFLESECEQCLHAWVLEGYDDGDDVPEYLVQARADAKLAATKVESDADGKKGSQ